MEPNNMATQTETFNQTEDTHISIPIETIKLWEGSINEAEKTRKLFDKLLPFHKREAARIQLARTVPVTAVSHSLIYLLEPRLEIPTEVLPVQKMVAGPNGRIALLLASQEHDTWCSHNAHVVVCHWNKVYLTENIVILHILAIFPATSSLPNFCSLGRAGSPGGGVPRRLCGSLPRAAASLL